MPKRKPANRQPSASALLKRAIQVAKVIEVAGTNKVFRKPLPVAGYGFLVRIRRLAQAIGRCGLSSAYESRVLMRCMLEIQINYAWIRLRKSHSRALRFHKYSVLDKLRLLEKSNTLFKAPEYSALRRALIADRRNVRHLFRFRDKHGKMQWSQSWASVSSVEARLTEIQLKAKPTEKVDPFLYGMYIYFSSATHGGPNSLNEVLEVVGDRLQPKRQPEPRPDAHYMGAFVLLAWTIDAFARDARVRRQHAAQINSVVKPLKARLKEANQRWANR